ncbi:NSFL1 cofactor p47 [Cryptotermes secundus]|uniref:NSFL1 cofactor p47 n=1 Tax=Cryptotermes secundus TaxID=105785 RepID=A0A2J7PDA4_9NEOP|nr:NSFL1 cofactor p47 isoform X2 [Cryptotermes secundus]PNF14314.1 NSFL1 cofactor p47 [Cryptotermes secundus]
MEDKDELLSQFRDVTGIGAERAKFYLESSAWQLEVALASFYENDGEHNPIEEQEESQLAEEHPVWPTAADPKPKSGGVSSSRFGTVAGLNRNDGSSDEEEGQAFYAGGSEHSGQQVIGPGKKKKDIVAEMFKSVQEQGAEVVDPRNPSQAKYNSFSGTGYRLGQSNNDSEVIGPPSSSRRESHTEVTLKLWKEGFSINDGAVREYADPANREFLDSVRRGEVPMELVREARGSEVHLNMEDHRHEEYVPLKPKVKAFSGKGHVLGSPSPATIGITMPLDEKDRTANEEQAKNSVSLDSSQPVTTVQIRLADGSRLLGQFNHSHTIADVRRFITTARPQYEHQTFSLLTTFPSKVLSDNDQTLDEAGILNAAVLQRLA